MMRSSSSSRFPFTSGAMKTQRGQKRRRGERDSLWDVVVKCDDLFHTYPSETESTGCEILVRSEYGDEEID